MQATSVTLVVTLVHLRRIGSVAGVDFTRTCSVIGTAIQHGGRRDALYGYRQRQQRDQQDAEQLGHDESIMTGESHKRSERLPAAR